MQLSLTSSLRWMRLSSFASCSRPIWNRALYPSVEAAAQTCFATIVTLVTEWVKYQPGSDPLNAARIVWALMHGIASMQHRVGLQCRKEILEFANMAVEALQQGLNRYSVTNS